jgi:hypothetical protein
VRVSRSDTLRKAVEIEKELQALGFDGAFVVSI